MVLCEAKYFCEIVTKFLVRWIYLSVRFLLTADVFSALFYPCTEVVLEPSDGPISNPGWLM